MTKRSKPKHAKLNMTFEQEFYNYLRQEAMNEHLPLATFVRKYLMDHMDNKTVD